MKTKSQKVARLILSYNNNISHIGTDSHNYQIIPSQPENIGIRLVLFRAYCSSDYITEAHCPAAAGLLQTIH